jgi:Spy/CpxP family protein refolding chaperone
MKRITMIISLAFVATFCYAQPSGQQRPQPPSTEERIAKATKELSLTDAQVKQWKEIHEKYGKPSEDQQKADETRKAMGKELEATLTKEQLEKFKKMRDNQRPPKQN